MAGNKFSTYKNYIPLCKNERTEKEIGKSIPIIINFKKIKCLRIKLITEVKFCYNRILKKQKYCKKKLKNILENGNIPCS